MKSRNFRKPDIKVLVFIIADQTSKQKPGSTSSASTSSSKKIPPKGIKKDLIRLEEVISGNSERSKESESESSTSGEYSSGDESDGGWEKKEIERGGADGKSKAHPSNLGKGKNLSLEIKCLKCMYTIEVIFHHFLFCQTICQMRQ